MFTYKYSVQHCVFQAVLYSTACACLPMFTLLHCVFLAVLHVSLHVFICGLPMFTLLHCVFLAMLYSTACRGCPTVLIILPIVLLSCATKSPPLFTQYPPIIHFI